MMSVIFSSGNGYFISHEKLLNEIYNTDQVDIKVKPNVFRIDAPYKTQSNSVKDTSKTDSKVNKNETFKAEITKVKSFFEAFHSELVNEGFLTPYNDNDKNTIALEAADYIQKSTQKLPQDVKGGNTEASVVLTALGDTRYVFPPHCFFYSKDVNEIESHIKDKFDLILLDPPWWNKYIRRKRKKSSDAYEMMYNDELKKIPVEKLLSDDGLVVVWCTNSVQHLEDLASGIFEKWGVKFFAKWYWVKVTTAGKTVCHFADPPRKQPFEQIVFGCKPSRSLPQPTPNKVIVSVPSVLHSHKPPLIEVLRKYLPAEPKCLEIFARYLLPGWSSYGLEVLKFQHECMYEISEKKCKINR